MKRDLDLMRAILLDAEASDSDTFKGCGDGEGNDEKIQAHTHWLKDLGFVTKYNEDRKDNVYRLTNGGHDFINLVRDPNIWENAKQAGLGVISLMLELLVKWNQEDLKKIP